MFLNDMPRRWLYWIISLVSLLFYTHLATCNAFQVIPALKLKQEYSDNLFFTEQKKISDWISTVSPKISINNDNEILKSALSANAGWIFYREYDELNSIDQDYAAKVNTLLGPRMSIAGNADYTIDSRRDRDLEETGLLILDNTDRVRQRYLLSGRYELSDRSSTVFTYTYNEDDYDAPEYTDYVSHHIIAGLDYQFDVDQKPLIGRLQTGGVKYKYPLAEIDNYTLTLGFDRQIRESISLSVDIGARYTKAKFDQFNSGNGSQIYKVENYNEEYGGVGNIQLEYQGLLTNIKLGISRNIYSTSGKSNTSEKNALDLSIRRWLSETLSLCWRAKYYLNESAVEQSGDAVLEEGTLHVNTSIRYEATSDLTLEGFYYFTQVRDNLEDSTIDRNLIYIQCRYKYTLF